jgi:hypothetical protein
MATQIEVLYARKFSMQFALYFVIPGVKQLGNAANPSRVASGIKLSVQELQDLKDGKLHERVITLIRRPTESYRMVLTRARLLYPKLQATAEAEYAKLYGAALQGLTYNGTNWV